MWMASQLERAGTSAPAVLFGLRLAASVCLALFLAFWFQLDDPFWAGTSASVVAQPGLGASLRKGYFRAIGTLLGGVAIVFMTAVFPQHLLGLLVTLTLWCALCGCFASVLPNFAGYAAALAGFTAAVVFSDVVDRPENVFMTTIWRMTEVGLGIVSAMVVHALTDLGDAREHLARALAGIGQGIAAGLERTLRTCDDLPKMREARRGLITRVIELSPTIDAAIGEPSELRSHPGTLEAAEESLFVALSAWRGVANHVGVNQKQSSDAVCIGLLPAVSKLAATSWLDARAVHDICVDGQSCAGRTSAPDLSSRLIVHGVRRTLQAFEHVTQALMLLTNRDIVSPKTLRTRLYVPDSLPVALNALRIIIALSVAELFWMLTGWPDGPKMILFTAVGLLVFSARVADAYSRALEYAIGTAFAGAVAVLLNFAVLPALHSDFLSLALVLCIVFVPVGMLAAGSWRPALFGAVATQLTPILAIHNERTYDGTQTLNTALAIFAGTMLATLFLRLLPPLSPARRVERLLALTLREVRALALGRRSFTEEAWIGRVSRRLSVMPTQATLEQEAELLAALAVGEAVVKLRPYVAGNGTLAKALTNLGEGSVVAAHEKLVRFSDRQCQGAAMATVIATDSAVQATLIADVLVRHPRFFAQTRCEDARS
jgi:uncharacterized membrane protein YccC